MELETKLRHRVPPCLECLLLADAGDIARACFKGHALVHLAGNDLEEPLAVPADRGATLGL
jgi:hypothetical protein